MIPNASVHLKAKEKYPIEIKFLASVHACVVHENVRLILLLVL